MSAVQGWQDVQAEVRRRIHSREWKPGDLIPNEVDLAYEFGCARATVNRALQSLAEAGFLDRRRRAGTRVALQPVAKATLDIALLRTEIETRGLTYDYAFLDAQTAQVPLSLRRAFGTELHCHVRALHLGNGAPFVVENRWINRDIAPSNTAFHDISPNEWLLINAPYTKSEIAFSAVSAGELSDMLDVVPQASVFRIERSTWDGDQAITFAELTFAPGYKMQTGF